MAAKTTVPFRIAATWIGLLGLGMVWMGVQVAFMGGTPYYLVAGALMTYSSIELWRTHSRGFYAFAAVLLLTLAWAVYEAGNDFWLVGSRIWIIGLLAIWLCAPHMRRPLFGEDMPGLFSMRTVQVGAAASAAVLIAMTVELFDDAPLAIPDTKYGGPQNTAQ